MSRGKRLTTCSVMNGLKVPWARYTLPLTPLLNMGVMGSIPVISPKYIPLNIASYENLKLTGALWNAPQKINTPLFPWTPSYPSQHHTNNGSLSLKGTVSHSFRHVLHAARMRASKYDVVQGIWKSVVVLSVMYGMEVIAWNESEIDKLEVRQNRVARMVLNAPRYATVEALRGDMGWSTFRERHKGNLEI